MTQPVVTLYVSDWCPYCQRAKNLLTQKQLIFDEINVDDDAKFRAEMTARSNRNTVPQVFIGDKHVGGCDDLFALDRSGGAGSVNSGGRLTSSPPSRDEDSFCKTVMSRREDIVSCIDVTIMDRSAHSALPSSYSKIFPAFRAGAAVTHAAGLGGKRFIDFLEPHACVIALVLQHGSKCAPARIEHRLASRVLARAEAFTLPTKIAPLAFTKRVLNLCKKSFRRFAILA